MTETKNKIRLNQSKLVGDDAPTLSPPIRSQMMMMIRVEPKLFFSSIQPNEVED